MNNVKHEGICKGKPIEDTTREKYVIVKTQ